LIAPCITRFENRGLKLVGLKLLSPEVTKHLLNKHYEEHINKPFFKYLVNYILSGPVVPMVWEGLNAVDIGRTIIGKTNPLESPPGTIRGDYALDKGRNIIHGSDSVVSAEREISIWFRPEDIVVWQDMK
jgi:nucleoside-diphosphate kinase